MQKSLKWALSLALPVLTFGLVPTNAIFTRALAQENMPVAEELVQGVNALRVANGMLALNEHPALMQIAQIEADGMAAGMGGHWRPNDMTLGQWLLSLGYPLSGDLSMEGYRSENVINGPDLTAQDAVEMWTGDDLHMNTMLSENRSDIGAAVSSCVDEWGRTVYYYVIVTALQTKSGKMQYDAYSILTALPMTQISYYGDATQAAQALLVPQYIIPVVLATARPDGDVIHEVKSGQSLWEIAIKYGVKIEAIRQLNNLPSTDIYIGQKLLVQKGATQPAPVPEATFTPTPIVPALSPTPAVAQNDPFPLANPPARSKALEKISMVGITVGIVLLALLFAGLFSNIAAKRVR
jgi:LysM repeat protein/uncharacterized protein YkwD